jgi:hypothetical protein
VTTDVDGDMSTRTARHGEMAEAGIRAHQALTDAHVSGGRPMIEPASPEANPTVFFTPQMGEQIVEGGMSFGATDTALRELQLYWTRIPDFGVKDAKVFPSDDGWAQVLYWGGTADNGDSITAQEVDVITTDDAFAITRFEIYSDAKQWRKIIEFVHGGALPGGSYADLIARATGTDAAS